MESERKLEGDTGKKKIINGLFWRYSERTCAQGVQFIVSIVLARLLSPNEYGCVGLITVLIAIGNVFVQAGFGNALIQKKDADQIDFSSVFYISIGMGILLASIVQFIAPYVAEFYEQPLLTQPIRVLSLMLVLAGINSVQQAYVSRKMIFKKFFLATIIGTIISAFVGIILAYNGFGIWALVAQQLTNQFIDTLVLWFTVRWRPSFIFSFSRVRKMFSFGWKLLVSSLIDTVYNNIYTFVIGKIYSAESVGYYNRGKNIPNLVITNINSSIQSVLFPAISKEQNNKERMKVLVRRSIMTSTFLIFPCMAGLAAVAEPLTVILLTEKWLPCVPFMQFCCFVYAFWPVHTANLQAISAMGRSDIYLKLEIQKKILGMGILIVTIPMGIYAMMVGRCISTVICSFLNAKPNKELLGYSFKEQLLDIMPAFILSIIMAGIVSIFNFTNWNVWIILIIQVLSGSVIYLIGAKVFRLESMGFLLKTLKQYMEYSRKVDVCN